LNRHELTINRNIGKCKRRDAILRAKTPVGLDFPLVDGTRGKKRRPRSSQASTKNKRRDECAAKPAHESPAAAAERAGEGKWACGPTMARANPILRQVYQWINELAHPDTRETALLELSKKRETDLAPMLWNSFGTACALLQEIVNIYPSITPPTLTAHQSNRVCNALALLQCVASHPETRTAFLQAQIPLYLYPFLSTTSKTRPFEYLRLTSLGVIGALVKVGEGQLRYQAYW